MNRSTNIYVHTHAFLDTPILGTEWRAINLGLLWFTGGLFSISLSVQTWIPALRERNVINALIICLTGRGKLLKKRTAQFFIYFFNYILLIRKLQPLFEVSLKQMMFISLKFILCSATYSSSELLHV